MSTGVNPSTKKRKYRPRNPPGPDRAAINWKEEEFQNLVRDMGFRSEWGAQFPTPYSTALDAPPGYITLYVAFFREGNFRVPMTKFTREVLSNYGLHISLINALGLPWITHFEFICRANRIEPTFEMFTVFYFVSYTGGFYSFNSRTSGVSPCSANPPKSLHDWKQKFFYIRRGVIPSICIIVTRVLTRKATSISQVKERALVGVGMSMLWAPQNPRGIPVYGYQGKAGYSLLNVLDPKAVGAMVEAILPEGKPVEVSVLSSEGSDRLREGLIPRSPRAGPTQGDVNEPVNEPVGDDVDVPSDAAEQLEARKKKKVDRPEKKKKVEEPVAKANRVKSGKAPRKVDISKITPASPPSRTFDLFPPHEDLAEKKKKDDVEVEQVGEGGAAGAGGETGGAGDDGRGEGVDTEAESSEATPRHTIYTKVVRGSGQGGASGPHHSPEYEHAQGRSWETHNPACADLPHAPRWNLTQGSRMTELANCSDAKEELAKEKQLNVDKQKDWEVACERTNKELQTQHDAIVRLSGEKRKISDEAEQERAAHQKMEHEYIRRKAKLEKFAEEKVAEVKASKILAEEVTADCRWLLARVVPLISERIAGSEELAKYMYELGEAAYDHGRKDGYAEGRAAAEAKEPLKSFELYKTDCAARYAEKR
ncbi:hypothetical protein Hdeb2414_s0007g00252361 [Helianthus debilis subsp. tardiflorus]